MGTTPKLNAYFIVNMYVVVYKKIIQYSSKKKNLGDKKIFKMLKISIPNGLPGAFGTEIIS